LLTAYGAVLAGRAQTAVAGIGVLGGFALLCALVSGNGVFVAWAAVLIGGEYAVALLLRDEAIDPWAPVYAGGLLLLAELGYWALERPIPPEPGLARRRAWLLAAMVVTAGGVAAVVLAVSEIAGEGGVFLQLLGVAAAVAVLALVVVYARRLALGSR
jgi:hypothetical protein